MSTAWYIYENEFVNDEVPGLHHQMLVMVARVYPPFLLALVGGEILRRTNWWPYASWAYLDVDDNNDGCSMCLVV